jgi:dipeptidyl aminopeptidase/acylaminoacyl peptidase
MTSTPAPGLSRRSLTTTALWTVPVVAIATGAPLAAASTAPCTSVTQFAATNASGNPAVLGATSASGRTSTIRITSTLAAGTTGGVPSEYSFSGFGPAGALVLNQRREGDLAVLPTPGSDAQTLTFEFRDADGALFDPVDFQLTVFDITSNTDANSWVPTYWDAVGFSTEPTSIATSGSLPGAGAGTLADPFRRATGNEYTTAGVTRSDTFHFGVFPSGSTLTYTQHDGRQGWHFVSLTDLRFGADDC